MKKQITTFFLLVAVGAAILFIWIWVFQVYWVAFVLFLTLLTTLATFLYREMKPWPHEEFPPMGRAYLKTRFDIYPSSAEFFFGAKEGKSVEIHPFVFRPNAIVIPKRWWDHVPPDYQLLILLYLMELSRALDESWLWKALYTLLSLFKTPFSRWVPRKLVREAKKRCSKWHRVDSLLIELANYRYSNVLPRSLPF